MFQTFPQARPGNRTSVTKKQKTSPQSPRLWRQKWKNDLDNGVRARARQEKYRHRRGWSFDLTLEV